MNKKILNPSESEIAFQSRLELDTYVEGEKKERRPKEAEGANVSFQAFDGKIPDRTYHVTI